MSLFQKTAKGLKWGAAASIGTVLIQFTLGVFLARLLDPSDYGLVAMITVFVMVANSLINQVLGTVMVQKNTLSDIEMSSLYFFNLLLGLLIFLAFVLGASRISDFYGRIELINIMYWLSPIVLMNSFGTAHRVKLERELNIRPIAMADLASVFLSASCAIVLALSGWGVWSLVAQALIKPFIFNLILFASSRWMPLLRFEWTSIRSTLGLTGTIMLNLGAEGVAGNIDRALVGRSFGSSDLGIYEKAKQLIMMPGQLLLGVTNRVLLPAMSQLQSDSARFSKQYLKIVSLVGFAICPLVIGLNVVSPTLIPMLFGDHWSSMVPVVQWLSWAGIFVVYNVMSDSIVISLGDKKGLLLITLLEKPIVFISVLISVQFGLPVLCWTFVAVSVLIFCIKVWITSLSLTTNLLEVIGILLRPLLTSVFMFMVVSIVIGSLQTHVSSIFLLAVSVVLGSMVYLLLSLITQKKALLEVKNIVNESFG